MWTLHTPWYELVIRGVSIYVFMFVLMRLWGKKHLGEMTAFDFILLLFMSEAVQNSLVDDDKSVFGGMIVIVTFLLMNIAVNKITYRSRMMEKILDGTPEPLILNGKVLKDVLKKEEITKQELMEAIRLQGVEEVSKVKKATLESNGHISVIEQ